MSDLNKIRRIFPRTTKIKLILLLIGIILGALIEMGAFAVISPFISILMDNSFIENNRYTRFLYRILGFKNVASFLAFLSVILALVYIFRGLYLYWLSRVQFGFLARNRVRLSDRLLEQTLKQPYMYHVNHNIAELQRLVVGEVERLFNVITQTLSLLSDGFMSLFIVSYLVSVSLDMTLVVMSFSLICIVIYFKVFRVKIKASGDRNYNLMVAISKSVNQALYGIKEIKIMRREEYFKGQFKTVSDEAIGIIQRFQSLVNLPKLFIESLCFGGAFLVVAFAISSGVDMEKLVPQLSVFVLAGFRLLPAISRLVTQATYVLHQKSCISIIYKGLFEPETLYIPNLEKPKIDAVSSDIVISDLTFRYPNMPNPVLKDVSLNIPDRKSVAFVGHSGAGKSTLTDIILGILAPQKGSVVYNGKSVHHDFDWWAQKVGYIPQVIYLLDENITENVAFGVEKDKIDEDKVWRALEQAHLKEFIQSLPDKLNTMIGDRGVRLSGGQRQRLGIARALYNDPPILVMDEATSSLDNETETAVMESIQGLHGSKTMLIVAHRLSTIEHCDIVYRIESGSVIRER